jgi:hypothetical protein
VRFQDAVDNKAKLELAGARGQEHDSTEARLVKQRLRKEGVRVMSVCQETAEDPIGNLIEGIFECIDSTSPK